MPIYYATNDKKNSMDVTQQSLEATTELQTSNACL